MPEQRVISENVADASKRLKGMLSVVQGSELVHAARNQNSLRAIARMIAGFGFFPTRLAAFDRIGDGYDVKEIPLLDIGEDPNERGRRVYLGSDGTLYTCGLLSLNGDQNVGNLAVDMTLSGRGYGSNEHYINFTKPAIRLMMHEVGQLIPATP